MTTYEIEVCNSAGRTVFTSNDMTIARRWARANQHLHDGLRVEVVTTTVRREVVFRPRNAAPLRLVGAG